MRRQRRALLLPLLGVAACLSAIRSTEGGRKEARRECLAAARNAGWRVLNISNAQFKGSGVYEVEMLVEKDSISQRPLGCSYEYRTSTSTLRPVSQ